MDIDQLLNRIMELIFEWIEADRGCIMLLDPVEKRLEPKVRRTRKGLHPGDKITISKTILDYVIERNEGVLTSDARQDDRWSPAASIVQMGIREAICVPMQGRYGVVGAIYIDTSTSAQQVIQRGGANKFSEDHLKLMIAIGHQAALAVEDTRYYSAMVQAERLAAVGQTIATLSHHIKNILQGIRGGSYLIELGLSDHDETVVSKGWKIVEKNQNKISTLVMDMLTFSKEREPELSRGQHQRRGRRRDRAARRPGGGRRPSSSAGSPPPRCPTWSSTPRGCTARCSTWPPTPWTRRARRKAAAGSRSAPITSPPRPWCRSRSRTTAPAFPPTRWTTSSVPSSPRRRVAARAWVCR